MTGHHTEPVRHINMADEIDEVPGGLGPEAAQAYLAARTQGLCHQGAIEVAIGVERAADERARRLEAVEFKIAHLERAAQELSDVVFRQQREIDGVLAAHQRLRQQLDEIDGRTGDASPVEIPPHY